MSSYRWVWLWVMVIGAIPVSAFAQTGNQPAKESHWGVGGSFIPRWTSHDKLKPLLFDGVGEFKGKEFSVGVVRGSSFGGEWGVSFVQKPFDDGSGTVESDGDCADPTFCFSTTSTRTTKSVFLRGVEVHWSIPFATIKKRVQLGLNVAVGAATTKGDVDQTLVFVQDVRIPNRPPIHEETTERFTEPAADAFIYKMLPLFKLEAQGTLIVSPALKIKVAGGLTFPGPSVRVGAVYLIGAK